MTSALSRDAIHEILAVASRAPSGVNSQPWQLLFLQGKRAGEVSRHLLEHAPALLRTPEAAVFRACGSIWPVAERTAGNADAYGDAEVLDQFAALDAPLAALCLFDRRLGHGSQLDDGMFIQSIVLLARTRGIRVRMLPAWQLATPVLHEPLAFGPQIAVLCGLAFDEHIGGPDGVAAARPEIIWLE